MRCLRCRPGFCSAIHSAQALSRWRELVEQAEIEDYSIVTRNNFQFIGLYTGADAQSSQVQT
jgi:hypothetical protein